MLILNRARRLAAHQARAAFTLIELLAVILIIGILAAFLVPKIPEVIDKAEVTSCKANMKAIGEGMLLHQSSYDSIPKQSGVKFFASLISRKVWEPTESSTKKLTCPGIQLDSLTPDQEGIELEDWYVELDRVDGGWSSYAGRDTKRFPVRKVTGKEILVADDNDGSGNHRIQTVALYGNYEPKIFDIVLEFEAGRATEEDEFVVVGPDAWIEDLSKLSLD